MRLLGGRFFRGGAKRPLFWLCKRSNKSAPGAGLEVFFSESTGKWVLKNSIGMDFIRSRLAMGVP